MNYKKFVRVVLSLMVVAVVAVSVVTQKQAESAEPEGFKITIKGKIDYKQSMGGYFVRGEEPVEGYFIMNENPKILEELFKSGKTLSIEGRIVKGAEYLFIEKIDGKQYAGKKAASQ